MLNTSYHLLIVDDEPVVRKKMQAYFKSEGYEVSVASSGRETRRMLNHHNIDVLLLDVCLPDTDGFELVKEIQQKPNNLGIILVTGRNEDLDRILGLEMGADDYVTKPFVSRELLARVKSLLRRVGRQKSSNVYDAAVRFSGWHLDQLKRQLFSPEGKHIRLTRAEFELMLALSKHPNIMMSRERLMKYITHRRWTPDDRMVDVLVKRIREKIEPDPKSPELIQTVYGEGYMLTVESPVSAAF